MAHLTRFEWGGKPYAASCLRSSTRSILSGATPLPKMQRLAGASRRPRQGRHDQRNGYLEDRRAPFDAIWGQIATIEELQRGRRPGEIIK